MDNETKHLLNDLWLTLSLYSNGYTFDKDQKKKHKDLILRTQRKLGIPDNPEDCTFKKTVKDFEELSLKITTKVKDNLKPGTQIIYIPTHADGPSHKDAEPGFVTSVTKHNAFCRYWNKHCPNLLRTTANSEGTPFDRIFIKDTREQSEVDRIMKTMDKP